MIPWFTRPSILKEIRVDNVKKEIQLMSGLGAMYDPIVNVAIHPEDNDRTQHQTARYL